MIIAAPERIDQVARVTRKGWSRSTVIRMPFSAPTSPPIATMPKAQAVACPGSVPKRVAASTVPRLIMPPIERSMPPRSSTMVWPVAASSSVIAAAVSRFSSSTVKTLSRSDA